MAIRTSKFVVAPLRGIDQRWESKPNHAQEILDMTWNDQDSWRTSAGYDRVAQDLFTFTETVVTESTQDTIQTGDIVIGPSTVPSASTTTSTQSSTTAVNIYDTESAPTACLCTPLIAMHCSILCMKTEMDVWCTLMEASLLRHLKF